MKINIEKKEIKRKIIAKHLFEKKTDEIFEINNIIYFGLGKKKEYNSLKLREGISNLIKYIQKRNFDECSLNLNNDLIIKNIESTIKILIETLILSKHENGLLKTKNNEKSKLKTFYIKTNEKVSNKTIEESLIIANSINWAKDLINLPSNIITPENFVKESKKRIKNVKIKILNRKEIIKNKLNLIEAVSRSSYNEPRFMIIEYKPKNHKNKKPYCLIGKGITFDTGGLSLKPSSFPGNFMKGMKCDMAGAASVVSVINIITNLKLNKWIIGLIPLTENTIGGNSYKVDDVLISHSGLSVEIINTDAEGRLILADALSYSKKYAPEIIIDIATLTGASLLAIGDRGACYMTNNNKLNSLFENSAKENDEKVWELPLWEEYNDLLKSDVADLSNVNNERGPGTIIGGLFLKNFVNEKTPWIHIDIGASAFVEKNLTLSKKGATGICIKTLYDFLKNY
ncbi:MAG: leucyl aminopeptidase family protein [Candidatus Woesearchaeota archaeon]